MIKFPLFSFLILAFVLHGGGLYAQSISDSLSLEKEFVSLEEALLNPENVYRLNLSNQSVVLSEADWSKFTNLQYLSLKNDHLKLIP